MVGRILRSIALLLIVGGSLPALAAERWLAADADHAPGGPAGARGALVWSHGRSADAEDSTAPTPPYIRLLQAQGWDIYRWNRLREADLLDLSANGLADEAGMLKRRGYRQVVLAGQSYGAFLSLMAADTTDAVDAVVATAPAAYGDFADYYQSYRENANRLYPLLRNIRHARTMLFFFHNDDFDPGGRGDASTALLAGRGLDFKVVDQPQQLIGHGAAGSGLFARRYTACIGAFLDGGSRAIDTTACEQPWGWAPSQPLLGLVGSSNPTGPSGQAPRGIAGTWYGVYLNGREVLLSVTPRQDGASTAVYALGSGLEPGQDPERTQRTGHIVGSDLIFDEPGRNPLKCHLRGDGRLSLVWTGIDSGQTLESVMRRIQ
jgi:pimeloyl-ACP methyl ester carboxylesterase